LITYCRSSAAKIKRRGERGSPCLTPLSHLNCLPGTPFSRMEVYPEEKSILIHYSHLSGKPMVLIISSIAECSTVSKALAKSNSRIMISFLLGDIDGYTQNTRQYNLVLSWF